MTAPKRVLINLDAGELADEPDALFEHVDIVNVACGGHAGDASSMRKTIEQARAVRLAADGRARVRIGAHPSFPDREGFGRRVVNISRASLYHAVRTQCEALANVAAIVRTTVRTVKAHGALYHLANREIDTAECVVEAAVDALGTRIVFIGVRDGALHRVVAERVASTNEGLEFYAEGFADRRRMPDGTLMMRGHSDAILLDESEIREAVERLCAESVDTICVHADSPSALLALRTARAVIEDRGVVR